MVHLQDFFDKLAFKLKTLESGVPWGSVGICMFLTKKFMFYWSYLQQFVAKIYLYLLQVELPVQI